MNATIRIHRWASGLCLLTLAAALVPATGRAATVQYPILIDTQIDSRDPDINFSTDDNVKVVVNGMDGSLARAVFELPAAALAVPLSSITSVTVGYYVWNDQTEDRTVRLLPLTQSFDVSTATWNTYDGTSAWATLGGDFDTGMYVDAMEPAGGSGFFTWDITSMWSDANLRTNGAILMMDDESDPGATNMPRAPFSSAESGGDPTPYVEITTVPEPGTCVALLVGSVLAWSGLRRGQRGMD